PAGRAEGQLPRGAGAEGPAGRGRQSRLKRHRFQGNRGRTTSGPFSLRPSDARLRANCIARAVAPCKLRATRASRRTQSPERPCRLASGTVGTSLGVVPAGTVPRPPMPARTATMTLIPEDGLAWLVSLLRDGRDYYRFVEQETLEAEAR